MESIFKELEARFTIQSHREQRANLGEVCVAQGIVVSVLEWLKRHGGYVHLTHFTVVDWLEENEFQLSYILTDPVACKSLMVTIRIDREKAEAETIYNLWPEAVTYEQEFNELYGIHFPGSPRQGVEFILEDWNDIPPMRRDFDTVAYCKGPLRLPSRSAQRRSEGRARPVQGRAGQAEAGGRGQGSGRRVGGQPMNQIANQPLSASKEVQLWVGPQHPGVPGNMAIQIWVEGDTITRGITHVGYLHRAFEKLMERRTWYQGFPVVCRICVPEPDTNELLLAMAAEELASIEVPERAQWIRTLVMELSRLSVLLMVVGGQAGGMGLGAAPQWMMALRDYVLDLFEELSGGRVYHMYIIYGGVRRDLPEGFAGRVEAVLEKIEERLPAIDNVMFENAVFRQRSMGVGVIPKEWAEQTTMVGPVVRAMGLARDVRKDYPYLKYPELDFDVVTEQASDIYARVKVRRREIDQSVDLIRQILAKMPKDGEIAGQDRQHAALEGSRGADLCAGRIDAWRVRLFRRQRRFRQAAPLPCARAVLCAWRFPA